ncbi:MAG TPA: ABC transporter ATP-binding protein [Vicinamibacterales bacterium]|nr:ABC transporter ATP-binding protein [Vicinamibacterales bacterium]
MTEPAIRIEGLSKQYQLGADAGVTNLRDRITSGISGALKRTSNWLGGDRLAPAGVDLFWALKDVSFDVPAGQVLGIIGGNGAGKSTLLKILSRITPPTEGRAVIRGHVASLLEVGTGFHPDLTGRENVRLNGAILGMSRADVDRRFDSIVEFAEIGRFIDTPVKRYSSGMYVRLAFAVAAHLEPEILIVDEVLAVGDARFQKKCLGKLDQVAGTGRTVLFVSHNMTAVQRLCTCAVVLEEGHIAFHGTPREAVARYLSGSGASRYVARARTGQAQVLQAELVDAHGDPVDRVVITDPVTIAMRVFVPAHAIGTRLGIGLLNADGLPILTSNLDDLDMRLPPGPTELEARVVLPPNSLLAGDYHVVTCLWNEATIVDLQEPAFAFATNAGTSVLYQRDADRKGVLHVDCHWQLIEAPLPASTSAS